MPSLDAAFTGGTLWVTTRRETADGRACRVHTLLDQGGAPLLAARAFNWRRDIFITEGTTRVMLMRRSRLFILSGNVSLLALPDRALIGQLHRSGRYRDAAGRALGRLRDARTVGERTREGLLQSALELATGGDGDSTSIANPTGFVLEIEGRIVATIRGGQRLPFEPADREPPSRAAGFARAILPQRIFEGVSALTATRGWRIDRTAPLPGDPRVHAAATLLAIEMSRWGG